MQLFRSFTAQYALSSLLSMAAPTSDSIADDSSSLTNERAPLWHKHYSKFGRDTGNTPLSREVKSALLAIGLSANSSRSLYSRPTAKLTRPKPGFSVLNPFYNHNLLPSRARRTNKSIVRTTPQVVHGAFGIAVLQATCSRSRLLSSYPANMQPSSPLTAARLLNFEHLPRAYEGRKNCSIIA